MNQTSSYWDVQELRRRLRELAEQVAKQDAFLRKKYQEEFDSFERPCDLYTA